MQNMSDPEGELPWEEVISDDDVDEMGSTLFQGHHQTNETCDHCGHHFNWGARYLHTPTNEVVTVGGTCSANTLSLDSRVIMLTKKAQKLAAAKRKARKIAEKAIKWAEEQGGDIARFFGADATQEAAADHHRILGSMFGNLRQYGSMSVKQVAFAQKLMTERNQREVREEFAARNDLGWLAGFTPSDYITDEKIIEEAKADAGKYVYDDENFAADRIEGELPYFARDAANEDGNRKEYRHADLVCRGWESRGKLEEFGTVSEKQIDFARKCFEELNGVAPVAGNAPEGKGIAVEGEVVGIKMVADNFSYGGGEITKLIVQLDTGAKVYGTAPSALLFDEEANAPIELKGKRINFTANFEVSDDDKGFGFFKRPRKAAIINTAE